MNNAHYVQNGTEMCYVSPMWSSMYMVTVKDTKIRFDCKMIVLYSAADIENNQNYDWQNGTIYLDFFFLLLCHAHSLFVDFTKLTKNQRRIDSIKWQFKLLLSCQPENDYNIMTFKRHVDYCVYVYISTEMQKEKKKKKCGAHCAYLTSFEYKWNFWRKKNDFLLFE